MTDARGESHPSTQGAIPGAGARMPPPPAAPPFPGPTARLGATPATPAPSPVSGGGDRSRPRLWGSRAALAGLALGHGPQAGLLLASTLAGSAAQTTEVGLGSALALIVGSLVVYGWQMFAAWWFSLRHTGLRPRLWGFRRPDRSVAWRVPAALVAVYAAAFLNEQLLHPRQQDILTQFPHSGAGVGLLALLAVAVAPPFEEAFFRGFVYRGMARSWGWRAAALVSGALFGLVHFQLDVALPLAVLGVALAWVYERTGSVWSSITLHALFNGLAVAAWAVTG